MSDITVILKNGKTEHFPETSRAGGSYCTSVKYQGEFAIIEDAHGTETVFPAQAIERLVVRNPRSEW